MPSLHIVRESKNLAPKSLFFPHWVDCPYGFYVRLVWACVMDLHRRKQDITCREIERITGISQHTIRNAIKTLAKDNLCTTPGRGHHPQIELIEPADDARYWAIKKQTDKDWLTAYGYTLVVFHDDLTAVQSVLLAKVGSVKGKQSYQGFAVMTGLQKKAVKRALTNLTENNRVSMEHTQDGFLMLNVIDHKLITDDRGQSAALNTKSNAADNPSNAADNPSNAADNPSNAADSHPSIKGIRLVLENYYSQSEEESSLGRVEKRVNNEETSTDDDTLHHRLLTRQTLERKVHNAIDLMQHFKFSEYEQKEIVGLFLRRAKKDPDLIFSHDFGGWIKDLVQEHKKRGLPGSGVRLVIYKLKVFVGDRAPTITPPKPKPVLTAQQKVDREIKRLFDAADREERGVMPANEVERFLENEDHQERFYQCAM